MNIESLRVRKAELDMTVMQLASQWQTAQGHLGEVNHWIDKVEKSEPSPCAFALASNEVIPVE